jgi:SsrA-binding protein
MVAATATAHFQQKSRLTQPQAHTNIQHRTLYDRVDTSSDGACILGPALPGSLTTMAKNKKTSPNTIALNRKARHEYSIEENFEAGLVLTGWEVKSLRAGRVQMGESYVLVKDGELWWFGGHITPLTSASTHVITDPTRTRKLLMHRTEIDRLIGQVERKGYTLVPLALYWSHGRAKLDVGLAKGKKEHDKRTADKDRDWRREKDRVMKHNR